MGPEEIDHLSAGYRELYAGNLEAALRAAVTDLLDVHDEVERSKGRPRGVGFPWICPGPRERTVGLTTRAGHLTLRRPGQGSGRVIFIPSRSRKTRFGHLFDVTRDQAGNTSRSSCSAARTDLKVAARYLRSLDFQVIVPTT